MRKQKLLRVCAVVAVAGGIVTSVSAAPTRLLGLYEEHAVQFCTTGNTDCTVYFSTIVKPLRITQVSCSIGKSAQNASVVDVTLGRASGQKTGYLAAQHLEPVNPTLFTASNTTYAFLVNTQHVVPASFRPAIEVVTSTATGAISLDCSISGSESSQ
jgi:hypothetical protein